MKRHEWILKELFCYNFNKFLQFYESSDTLFKKMSLYYTKIITSMLKVYTKL